jgi:hypothetical protein
MLALAKRFIEFCGHSINKPIFLHQLWASATLQSNTMRMKYWMSL